MRAQFSVEFVLDVSFIIAIVAFIAVFFANTANINYGAASMNTICQQIAQTINAVSNSGGLTRIQHLNLLNLSGLQGLQSYNVSISRGVIIIYLTTTSSKPLALITNTNIVSCGSDTLATANESFLASNLAVFKNQSAVDLAYLAGNYTFISGPTKSATTYPVTIDGGGFVGNASFSLLYPNGTEQVLKYYTAPFIYNSTALVGSLSTGNYNFYLTELSNSYIYVTLPLAKN